MEIPELETVSTGNAYPFHYVPHVPCDDDSLKIVFNKYPFYDNDTPSVDGLLFYHKEASYVSGRTPLVGWLKPYMVPEILSMYISTEYLYEKPDNYISLPVHIKNSRQRRHKKSREIEVSHISHTNLICT